jgi:hypothetical protein
MKISPVEAELFQTDRRTDMTNLIVDFAILRTRNGNNNIAVGLPEEKKIIRFKCEDIIKMDWNVVL